MATLKEAVHNARIFAVEALEPERVAGLQLEEVESGTIGGDDAWLITLSMIAPFTGSTSAMNSVLNAFAEPKREYKIFTVLKKNGEVASMKIRELATT
jgi:hypothetical protein